jgi:hypothetical protein
MGSEAIMNKTVFSVTTLIFGTASALSAEAAMPDTGAAMTFEAFHSVSGGVFDDLPAGYYSVADNGVQNLVTHLLVGPLLSEKSGAGYILGDYSAQTSSGVTVSDGTILFECETGGAEDNFACDSPVVGCIPLESGWENGALTIASPGMLLDGADFDTSYSTGAGVVKLTTGSSNYYLPFEILPDASINFENPIRIGNGDEVEALDGGNLHEADSGALVGVLYPMQSDAGTTGGFYRIILTDPNDGDSDGAADILDSDNYWYFGADLVDGVMKSGWFGDFYIWNALAKGVSGDLFDPYSHAWIWQPEHGWLYTASGRSDDETWAFFFDYNLGWIATSSAIYPFLYAYDATFNGSNHGEAWLYYYGLSDVAGQRWFYALTADMSTDSNSGHAGWWLIDGANAFE